MARWEALRKKDAVSQQELDERRSAFAQASSNLAAADANVERLRQVEGFKRIVAPFSGIITRRNVDVGDLIDPGAGRALFVLSQTDPLRVYVNVPQAYANLVKTGQQVTVTQSELRGRKFEGKVARTAGSIDAATRSMQIEVTSLQCRQRAAARCLRAGGAAVEAQRHAAGRGRYADVPA
jgi:RND family efflux transporter MFP subunit